MYSPFLQGFFQQQPLGLDFYLVGGFNDTNRAVVEPPTVAQRVAGSIPAWNKYVYGLQVVVLDLMVCVCVFSVF